MKVLLDIFKLQLRHTVKCEKTKLQFENSLRIYINKPQVVNKWLAGSVVISEFDIAKLKIDDLLNKIPNEYQKSLEYREFIPKNSFKNVNYVIIHAKNCNLFMFIPIGITNNTKYCSPSSIHCFQFDESDNSINLYVEENIQDDQIVWLKRVLMKKILHWCLTIKSDETFSCSKLSTLTLYSSMVADYMELYQELKNKYWLLFSTNWLEYTSTDPQKYLTEDISIATYLILVWRFFDVQVKRFVDLGCGNGLLVYILNDQGYNGYGVDLTKRRIWDLFKINDCLVEKAVDPRVDTFSDCDWLIGNHSDELSPWLPVMANRSSETSKAKSQSKNDTYLDYLIKIFKLSGFTVYKDKLRIPSTRNTCIIGIREPGNEANLSELGSLIRIESDSFQIRDVEKEKLRSMRNCTKNVDNDIKTLIIQTVLEKLLASEQCVFIDKFDNKKWNAGGLIKLNEIASLFEKDVLVKLKQECGGIKTLLKNHHQLFEMVNNDQVKLRLDLNTKETVQNKNLDYHKTKNCLFDLYHPNGCLLENDKCNFIHKDL